ncbi:MAG TPA: branched-chain amino acid ABC transporter permease [Limnochordales bacterium]
MSFQVLLYQGLVGLSSAMYLWLLSAGLTIVFGVLGVLNFAHGAFFMIGAYLAYTFYGILGWNLALSIALSLLCTAVIGVVVERFLVKPIMHLDHAFQLLLTFGLVLIFDDLAKAIWGGVFMIPPMPRIFQGAVWILGTPFPIYNVFVICAGVAVFVLLWLLFEKTWWGRIVRATAADPQMAAALGVDVKRLYTGVFALGVMLAALGGALGTPVRVVAPGMGSFMIVQAFIVTVLGGLGSLSGAFVGALLVGVLSSYGTLLFPTVELALIYLIMSAMLLVRPHGLFGRAKA